MIEQIVLNHMDNKLDVRVDMERNGQAVPFVLIEKTGSSREDYLNIATFAFQSYGKSLLEAAMLNEDVKKAAYELTELGNVTHVKLNSDYNFTDTSTKDYRYQALFDVYYL